MNNWYWKVPMMFAMGFGATWLSARLQRRVVSDRARAARGPREGRGGA